VANNSPAISVSAIVVTHNSAEFIITALISLQEEINSIGGEIIVFDNGSRDTTVAAIREKFPKVSIIESLKNIGFAAACNKSIEVAHGEYILLANPDMILDQYSLGKLLKTLIEMSAAGAVVGRMRNSDGTFQPTCRQLPDIKNIIFSRRSIWGGLKKSGQSDSRYTLGDFDQNTVVPAAAATCLLMRRDYFLKLGGFDRRFFLFMEDTDLSLRINQAGKKIYFVPAAGAVHHWGKGAPLAEWRRRQYHHMSLWKYFLKHYPNGFSLLLLPILLLLNFFLSGLIFLLKRKETTGG
jgi:N-acetylglucosaminyl-diphospho-decaprenol L-rhamnosyltransferase